MQEDDNDATGASNLRRLAAGGRDPMAEMTTPPTRQGPHGRAWLVDIPAQLIACGLDPLQDVTVSAWIVEAPWAHPLWHSYVVILVHLRPLPGRPLETVYYLDGATHEMWVFALDPAADRQAMLKDKFGRDWLHPKNFGAQIIAATDNIAMERVSAAVGEIVDGKLSPDTDFLFEWVRRFGDNMVLRS